MLFNYLKYYEMVKQTVCEKASGILSSYNEALSTNNALQVKNETAKKRAANVNKCFLFFVNISLQHIFSITDGDAIR